MDMPPLLYTIIDYTTLLYFDNQFVDGISNWKQPTLSSRGIQDAAVAALVIRFIQPVDTPWELSIAVE